MLAVIGTVPDPDFPLVSGPATLDGERLTVAGYTCQINRGTPALLAAAIQTALTLGQSAPQAYLIGDIGLGDGSKRLYEYLCRHLQQTQYTTMCFHYLLPDVDWHNRVFFAIEAMARRPILIADAGFMYVAKMSGQAGQYDLFTPDVGELAFLADEEAPHPFYTRGFILHEDNPVPDLITRAYTFDNAAKYLLVKGRIDYVAAREGILAALTEPTLEVLEPIGGTGDTITGIAAALIDAGGHIPKSAFSAARTNRLAGLYANPTPATQVTEIIKYIPKALKEVLAAGTPLNHDRTGPGPVTPDMTLLDIMSRWRSAENIFKAYEAQAGTCLSCHALFDTLAEAAEKYHLDLAQLLADLNALALNPDPYKETNPQADL